MSKEEVKFRIRQIQNEMRVTEICCSRQMNGNVGERTFVSYKADMGEGGVSMEDAKIAAILLGLEVDQATLTNAIAGGAVPTSREEEMLRGIRARYGMALSRKSGLTEENEDG